MKNNNSLTNSGLQQQWKIDFMQSVCDPLNLNISNADTIKLNVNMWITLRTVAITLFIMHSSFPIELDQCDAWAFL